MSKTALQFHWHICQIAHLDLALEILQLLEQAVVFSLIFDQEGDYRIIYEIRDDEVIIVVVKAAHRKEVYRHT